MLLLFSILIAILITVILVLTEVISYWWSILVAIGMLVAVLVVYLLIVYVISLFIMIKDKEDVKPRKFYGFLIHITCRFLVTVFTIKVHCVDLNKLDGISTCLLTCNHQSNFDPIVKLSCIKDYRMTVIMKKEVMNIPIIGRCLHAAGYFLLNRNNAKEAVKTISQAIKRIDGGDSLIVYPEGTRSKNGEIGEYKDGTFKIAQKTKCPIVVTIVDNVYRAKENIPFKKTDTIFKVCKVIPYSEYEGKTTHEIRMLVEEITKEELVKAKEEYPFLRNASNNKCGKYEKNC